MSKFAVHVLSPGKEVPFPSFVQVVVSEYSKDNDGRILISPQLASADEVDYQILADKAARKCKKRSKEETYEEVVEYTHNNS